MLTFFNLAIYTAMLGLAYWFGFNQGKEYGYGKGLQIGHKQGFEQFRARLLKSLDGNRAAMLAGALRKIRDGKD